MDRFDDANAVFAAYRKETEEFGASWAAEFCERCACYSRMMAGHLDEAAVEAEATLALIADLDMWHDSDIPLGVLSLVALHRNDMEAAEAHLARSHDHRPLYGRGLPAYLIRAEAALCDAQGDPATAVKTLHEIFDMPELLTQNLSLEPGFAPALVRLACRAEDPVRAEIVTAAAEELAQRNQAIGTFAAAAAQCAGLTTGDTDCLVDAAEALRGSPRLMARASAFEDAGRALLERGKEADSAAYLIAALDAFGGVGAARDEARVRRLLRRAGVRRPPRRDDKSARPTVGWDSLTSAELRVVRLVAQGLTNRQVADRLYLSSYTVGT